MPELTAAEQRRKGVTLGSELPLANEKPSLQQQGFAASCMVLVLSALAVFGYAAVKYQRDQEEKAAARAAADAAQAIAQPDVPASADELARQSDTL